MNRNVFILIVATSLLFTSCATIFGGRKYNATIKTNRPNAEIWFNNQFIGHGNGKLLVLRKDANKISIEIKERGCLDTQFFFSSRKLRPLVFANAIAPVSLSFLLSYNVIFFRQEVGGSPVRTPISIDYTSGNLLAIWTLSSYVDLINFSSMYKPNENEPGIYKINDDSYEYRLNSTCIPIETTQYIQNTSTKSALKGVVYLKNGSVIRGSIIEIIPNKSIKIQTIDGSIFVFKFEEIERYTQE